MNQVFPLHAKTLAPLSLQAAPCTLSSAPPQRQTISTVTLCNFLSYPSSAFAPRHTKLEQFTLPALF